MAESHPIPARPNFKNLTGRTFGKLTVESYAGPAKGHQLWNVRCACGNTKVVRANNLVTANHSTSCGCVQADRFVAGARARHRHSRRPEWTAWQRMKQRCHNPANPGFVNYGARGIFVCERWRESFDNFLADVGPRPSAKHSLGRADNDGPYCPENCRWETVAQQMSNRRCTRALTFRGRTMTLAEWARTIGMATSTLHIRLQRGWPVERALTTPCQQGERFDPFTFIA